MLRICFARKNPTASAGFEPANSGTRSQHANICQINAIHASPPCVLKILISRRMCSKKRNMWMDRLIEALRMSCLSTKFCNTHYTIHRHTHLYQHTCFNCLRCPATCSHLSSVFTLSNYGVCTDINKTQYKNDKCNSPFFRILN
jgi:hypothetical protein